MSNFRAYVGVDGEISFVFPTGLISSDELNISASGTP
jgi:hypothetical protein